jgi:two-component system cell cycle sensor histidine kinase/response regulator CckA
MMALGAGLAAVVAAWIAPAAEMRMAASVLAGCLLVLGLGLRLRLWLQSRAEARRIRLLAELVGLDATPCVMTDRQGALRFFNDAAKTRLETAPGKTLASALGDQFASPSAVLFRLQSRALTQGSAREDVVSRRGHIRLSVARVGADRFLWRLEEFQDSSGARAGAESLSLPMVMASKAGVVLYCNEAMRRLIGGRPKRLDRIFTTAVLHSGEEVEIKGVDGPTRAILAEIDGPGERREIYLLPVPVGTPAPTSMADFDTMPVPLAKFAPSGALIVANAAARAILNLDGETPVMFHDLVEGLGRPVADWMDDIVAERVPPRSEIVRARRANGERFLQVMLRRIVEHGRPGVLVVLQDATDFKTLEAQFVQAQKMQAIGQLAGGIAHDFNNLLTAISGHCDLLLLRHTAEDPDFSDLTQINQNANRAAALVSQLLAYSRKQTLKPERLDLEDVLSDLAHLLSRLVGEKVRLQVQHGARLGAIRADKRQLEQVLMNLVVNARDAMSGTGGTIRVETEEITLSAPMIRDRATVPAGEYAVIRVIDTGCGIPEDRLQKIFEPFYTTKKVGEGTGLGLSTAYGIVKQSGGFIFVDSEVGKGSTFALYFPINSAPAEVVEEKKKVVLKQGEGVVLLVEDEAPVRAFASRALRMRGYTVLEAENAEEALKTLEDPSLNVDVFVTDVVMPGMDGPSWVRQALTVRPSVKVIFVSGYAEDALSETQMRIPNSVFLPKPFSLSDLTATVQGQMQLQ